MKQSACVIFVVVAATWTVIPPTLTHAALVDPTETKEALFDNDPAGPQGFQESGDHFSLAYERQQNHSDTDRDDMWCPGADDASGAGLGRDADGERHDPPFMRGNGFFYGEWAGERFRHGWDDRWGWRWGHGRDGWHDRGDPSATPIPPAMLLLASGLAGLAFVRRRRVVSPARLHPRRAH